MSTQQEVAAKLVAQMRNVGIPADDAFFARIQAKLSDERQYAAIMADPEQIVTAVCYAWIVANRVSRLPSGVDLWPFIEVITPAELVSLTAGFWRLVRGAAREMDKEGL